MIRVGRKVMVRIQAGVGVRLRLWKQGRTQSTPSPYNILFSIVFNNN